jgi:hypothetical protein
MTPTTIADAVARITAEPAAVLIIDTCSLLDLFRFRFDPDKGRQPLIVPVEEIQAATDLLTFLAARPAICHIVVPELVPREFSDHASLVEDRSGKWLKSHAEDHELLIAKAAILTGESYPKSEIGGILDLHTHLRKLAESLLAQAIILARHQTCLDRAVTRLVEKKIPSHNKEMKDSMNLEQCLELGSQLRLAASPKACLFISSNTTDFAQPGRSSQVHAELRADFASASLEYFTSLRAAVGSLRARGELPVTA